MKSKLGTILKRLVFAFGIIYGINVMLKNVGIYIPINIITIGITSFLGVPGLLSLFTIFYIIN
ncbi:MAG: pro-sigmaK processing inhibitor BofA family protein [Bacilli bacterium]|nr:pro-sigmaK processing inhibitor BofA family protein [Bacilli bacterium]MBQ8901718.1 pro-sigmaK processing inhibitor BofA family protein [Bacilli bacterium]